MGPGRPPDRRAGRRGGDFLNSTLAERFLRVRAGNAVRERDPLTYWHHSSSSSAEATRLLSEVDEVYVRAANKGGKTEWEYAVGLAILQKRSSLDGIPLPQWRGRIDAVSLEIDHEQQKLSSQQTVLRLLGSWPHHASWKANNVLAAVRIKPAVGLQDERFWSTLTFMSQENRRTGTGVRADLVLANEPPREDIWRELRKAAHAGRRIVRIIGATPIHRRQWDWLKRDYSPEAIRRGIQRHADWAEVRWSLQDNRALSSAEIAKLLREYGADKPLERRDPLFDARVYGDYIDTTGLCPFDVKGLMMMLEECEDPDEHEWNITREIETSEGRVRTGVKAAVHVLREPVKGRRYYIAIDPSKGIEDASHDPGGLLVEDEDTGEDVALYEGFIGSYGLGVLAAGLGRQYNYAIVDVESNSGWAEGVYRGLADSGYGNLAKTLRMGREGKWEPRLGFETTQVTRPAMFQEIQWWSKSWADQARYAPCRFRRVIEALLDVIVDPEGRPVAAPGRHDEFAILKGQALRKRRGLKPDPDQWRPPHIAPESTADERIIRRLNEAYGDEPRVGGGDIPRPKVRPRV